MDNTKIPLFVSASLLLLFYISILVGLAQLTNAGIDKVFIGLLPFLFYLIFLIAAFHYAFVSMQFLLFGPLALCGIFILLWAVQESGFLAEIDGPQLAVLNLLLAYMISAAVFFSRAIYSYNSKKQKHYYELSQRYTKEIEQLKETINRMRKENTEKNFATSLQSIEDKCKAINFAIGRVYGAKKGGNFKLREKIIIKHDTYNLFSEIASDFKKEDEDKLNRVLKEILNSLLHLELTEKEIFSPIEIPKLSLVRDILGNDKVIDVLAKNDKDPVYVYHSEAKEICKNLSGSLENLEITKPKEPEFFHTKNLLKPVRKQKRHGIFNL